MTYNTHTNEQSPMKKGMSLRDEIRDRLQRKDYLLTIYQTGDPLMANGDFERMVLPKRFYRICALEEIPEVIKFMREPFWNHPKLEHGMPDEVTSTFPFIEKQWGIYYDLDIMPLSVEKEETYLELSRSGLLEVWRTALRTPYETGDQTGTQSEKAQVTV